MATAGASFLANQELLFYVAQKWYGVPRTEAEAVVQDILVSYLECHSEVRNLRLWMVGAGIRACRRYWSQRRRTVPLPPEAKNWPDPALEQFPDDIANRLALRKALAAIPARCRDALGEKYHDDRSLREIAERRRTTEKYAKKLVYSCLKELRLRYFRLIRLAP